MGPRIIQEKARKGYHLGKIGNFIRKGANRYHYAGKVFYIELKKEVSFTS